MAETARKALSRADRMRRESAKLARAQGAAEALMREVSRIPGVAVVQLVLRVDGQFQASVVRDRLTAGEERGVAERLQAAGIVPTAEAMSEALDAEMDAGVGCVIGPTALDALAALPAAVREAFRGRAP